MSLVNQVLRDLHDRRSDSPVADGLVAAAPERPARPAVRWVAAGVAAVAVGVFAFIAQHAMDDPAPPADPVAQTPVPAPAATVVAAAEPELTIEEPPVVEPEAVTDAIIAPEPETAAPVSEPVQTVADTRPREPAEPAMTRTLVPSTPRSRALEAYAAGIEALRAGRRAAAAAHLRAAVAHDATLTDARLSLAETLAGNGELREAESVLQAGLAVAPDPTPIAERYARLLLDRGDLAGALGVLGESAPAVADAPDYHALYAAVQQRAGNHAAASATYAALVALRPDAGIWWVGLGISLEAQARFDEAAAAYGKASADARLRPEVARFVHERLEALSR